MYVFNKWLFAISILILTGCTSSYYATSGSNDDVYDQEYTYVDIESNAKTFPRNQRQFDNRYDEDEYNSYRQDNYERNYDYPGVSRYDYPRYNSNYNYPFYSPYDDYVRWSSSYYGNLYDPFINSYYDPYYYNRHNNFYNDPYYYGNYYNGYQGYYNPYCPPNYGSTSIINESSQNNVIRSPRSNVYTNTLPTKPNIIIEPSNTKQEVKSALEKGSSYKTKSGITIKKTTKPTLNNSSQYRSTPKPQNQPNKYYQIRNNSTNNSVKNPGGNYQSKSKGSSNSGITISRSKND